MTQQSGYLVARHEHTVYVRSVGLANMKNAPLLDAFLHDALEQGLRRICVDLSSCTGMDSTFMGTLVGHAESFRERGGQLVVVGPSSGNLKLLEMLGVVMVLPVVAKCELPQLEFVTLAADSFLSTSQRTELIRRAHQNLSDLSEANRAKFGQFLQTLDADLARLRAAQA